MSVVRRVTDIATRLLFTPATIASVTEHDQFRAIELCGDRLIGTDAIPGDKARIRIDGLQLRTYTPIAWDRDAGTTRILAYLPGDGPGSSWCERAQPGDGCMLFGPQRSVRLDGFSTPPIIVGDETSFGLLLAWRQHSATPPAATIFEVTRDDAARSVLDAYGASPTHLVTRAPDDAHLVELGHQLVEVVRAQPEAPLCFTGRAQTIAALRRRLKADGLTRPGGATKAYWDQNRKGLD